MLGFGKVIFRGDLTLDLRVNDIIIVFRRLQAHLCITFSTLSLDPESLRSVSKHRPLERRKCSSKSRVLNLEVSSDASREILGQILL